MFWERRETVEKEGERREEEEEDGGAKIKANKVWKLTLIMNSMRFGMDLWFSMIIIFPKLWVLLGFHLNPKIMESKVGKIPYGTRWLWNSPFRLDSWLNDK